MWWNTNLCVTGSGRRLFFLSTTTDDISQDSETCCLPASIESILMVLLILLLLAIMGITISSPPRLLSLFLQMLLTSVVGGIMCSIHRNSRGNFRNANQKIICIRYHTQYRVSIWIIASSTTSHGRARSGIHVNQGLWINVTVQDLMRVIFLDLRCSRCSWAIHQSRYL